MKAEELIGRLESVRRRLRRLLACDGIARLLAAAVVLFVLAALVDWWVRVPAALRAAATVIGVVAAAAWSRRRIVAPLKRALPLQEIAVRLDRQFPEMGNRLATALEWLEGIKRPFQDASIGLQDRRDAGPTRSAMTSTLGAGVLWNRVVAQTLAAAERLPWNEALTARRSTRSMSGALLLVCMLGAWAAAWPSLVTVGAARYAWPFGSAQWPRSVLIEPLTGDLTAAAGETATVQMRLARGWSPGLRAWTVWSEQGQRRRRELMSPGGDRTYSFSLDHVSADATYWFEAGDDSTQERPARVRLVTRPVVEHAAVRFTPPAYASALGETVESLEDGHAEGLEGSAARIEFDLSKPAGRDSHGRPAMRLAAADGRVVAMIASDGTGRRWNGTLELNAPTVLELSATDADGLSVQAAPRIELAMRRDASPSVAIVRPTHTEEVTPDGEVAVRVAAEDDVDVAAVRMRARVIEGSDLGKVELWSGSARKGSGAEPVRVELEERLALAGYKLSPGAVVEYWAEAEDAYEHEGTRHPAARSAVMKLRVISPGELSERVRDELVTLARRLQKLRDDQESNRKQTAALPADENETAVRSALERQRAIASGARSAAEALRDAADRLRRNHDKDAASRDQAERAAGEVRAIADGPMALAGEKLRESRAAADTDAAMQRGARIAESAAAQGEAVARLDRLIGGLQRWTDFDGMVQKTRNLLDRQEAVARATAAVTGDLSGRRESSLTAEEQARLKDAAGRQEDLGRELAELLKSFEKMAASLERKDRAAGESLSRAKEAAEREQVGERMADAAAAVRENKGLRAEEAQQSAARGLAAMVEALHSKAERELAELTKELAAATARLEKLIRAQETLNGRTQSAARQADAAAALPGIAPQQKTLKGTADSLAVQIDEGVKEGGGAAAAVREAAGQMGLAGQRLGAADGGGAAVAQVAAVDALRKARGLLDQVQAKADEAAATRALEKIREELEAVRTEQVGLATAAEEVQRRQARDGRLGRVDGIKLNRMAQDEEALVGRVDAVRGTMENSTVFDYVCREVAGRMRAATGALRSHELRPAVEAQRAAIELLSDLLRTLDEAAEPGEQSKFASDDEGDGGGGDGGEAKKSRPIPPLAELKMLRVLQSQVNEATREFDARVPPAEARSEAELGEARALGERQRRLHALAEKVMAGAKGE